MEGASGFIPIPVLVEIIKDFMFHRGNQLAVVFTSGEDPVEGSIFAQLGVEVEAAAGLHRCRVGLVADFYGVREAEKGQKNVILHFN